MEVNPFAGKITEPAMLVRQFHQRISNATKTTY
jgi:hypothetical protein